MPFPITPAVQEALDLVFTKLSPMDRAIFDFHYRETSGHNRNMQHVMNMVKTLDARGKKPSPRKMQLWDVINEIRRAHPAFSHLQIGQHIHALHRHLLKSQRYQKAKLMREDQAPLRDYIAKALRDYDDWRTLGSDA